MPFPCACCGYLTLTKSVFGAYELCPVCYWEDDWQQAQNQDQATGANSVSLKRAKLNYRLFGAVEERFIGNVRRPRDNERPPQTPEAAASVTTEEARETRSRNGSGNGSVDESADDRDEHDDDQPQKAREAASRGRSPEHGKAKRGSRARRAADEERESASDHEEISSNGHGDDHEWSAAGSAGSGGYAIDASAVREAATRIGPHANRTPVMTSSYMDSLAGRALFFKCEMFQKVGAFKFRGACNAVMKLPDQVARRGVVTHSSGNHAQAVALAANLRGIRAHIVMPRNSSPTKIRAAECYGGRITLCEPTQADREGTAQKIARETGATLIPPYNHPDVIAGQGTTALELFEQVVALGTNELDAIVAPIGGGGLISGICIAAKAMNPRIRIFAAEPSGADDAARSHASGVLQPQGNPKTIADGLLTAMGDLTWPIVRDHVERVLTVSDDLIIAAMRLIFERMKLVVEPSAATALAAALSDEFRMLRNVKRVGIVLSGGNVDLDKLPWSSA